jgi:hypothetical protein
MTFTVWGILASDKAFTFLFISPYGKAYRTWFRASFNSFIHLVIMEMEALSIGYTWSNYFSLMPAFTFLTNLYNLSKVAPLYLPSTATFGFCLAKMSYILTALLFLLYPITLPFYFVVD